MGVIAGLVTRWRRGKRRLLAAAVFLLFLYLVAGWTPLYGDHLVGNLLSTITFLMVFGVGAYYTFVVLRWLKNKLLWRVRRRLIITYLFVGLTPIVLLAALGMLSAFGGSCEAMSRIVAVQLDAMEQLALASLRQIADDYARQSTPRDAQRLEKWLEERAHVLRTTLPGARLCAWHGAGGTGLSSLGHQSAPSAICAPPAPAGQAPAAGIPIGDPLPAWLVGKEAWSGFAHTSGLKATRGSAGRHSIRALVRRGFDDGSIVFLMDLPVDSLLVARVREQTGIDIDARIPWESQVTGEGNITIRTGPEQAEDRAGQPPNALRSGQQGAESWGVRYPLILNETDWPTGATSPGTLLVMRWSWGEARRQLLGTSILGSTWQQGLIAVGIAFMVFELLALLAAIWMTRAVTGTVHELHLGTEYVKRGDFGHRVRVHSHDQLGELVGAFNEMSGHIENLLEERVERERLEREVEIAADVQAQLFPRDVPHMKTVEIAAECRAARGVAGDYYDYVQVARNVVLFALGDVSGKGLSASLVMSNLQASFRAQTTIMAEKAVGARTAAAGGVHPGFSLAEIPLDVSAEGTVARTVSSINRQLCRSIESGRYATLFLGLYDDDTGVLRYTNAGHNPALLIRSDGSSERLATGGMMVGAFDSLSYEESSVVLTTGATLVVFSDGLSEARDAMGEEYGEDRLVAFSVAHRESDADRLRTAIFDEIDRWSGEREREDDQTLVILKATLSPTA
ncbi:MAG: SpoIIE family protein phosphatase [Acidobacteriota bacterium]